MTQGWTGEVSEGELKRLRGMVDAVEAKIAPLEVERRTLKGQITELQSALASKKWRVKVGDVVMVGKRERFMYSRWVEAQVVHIDGRWDDRPWLLVHMKLKGGAWSKAHRAAYSHWITVAEWEAKGKPETEKG